jgi:hypothetical protein
VRWNLINSCWKVKWKKLVKKITIYALVHKTNFHYSMK